MWPNSKNPNCDKNQKLKLWQNSKTQTFDKTQKLKLWQNSKTWTVTKLKKNKLWQKWKTHLVKKLKNLDCDKTKKIQLWQNSKTKIGTEAVVRVVTEVEVTVVIVIYFSENNFKTLTTNEMFSGKLFSILAMFLQHVQFYKDISFMVNFKLDVFVKYWMCIQKGLLLSELLRIGSLRWPLFIWPGELIAWTFFSKIFELLPCLNVILFTPKDKHEFCKWLIEEEEK